MLTIKKLLRLVIMTLLPALLYEVGALGFYIWMKGSVSFTMIHRIAWEQDLAVLILLMTAGIFFYLLYKLFINEEESKIEVKRYERPKHEKYMRVNHHDLN